MTLTQFLEVVRRRHNAESDSYWSDDEIYQLITNRINSLLAKVPLLEATTTDTSVADQQAYDFPSDATTIRQVSYDGERCKRISFRQWELYRARSGDPTGTPEMWVKWNRQINLVPIPDTAGDTVTIYYYKEHPYIDGSTQTTIDIPSVLHPRLVSGVLSDMFAKDLNHQMSSYYEQIWLREDVPAIQEFKSDEESDGSFDVLGDADSDVVTDLGPV